jgi:hypothetical protein
MKDKLEMLKALAQGVAEVAWFLAGPAPEGYSVECWNRK